MELHVTDVVAQARLRGLGNAQENAEGVSTQWAAEQLQARHGAAAGLAMRQSSRPPSSGHEAEPVRRARTIDLASSIRARRSRRRSRHHHGIS